MVEYVFNEHLFANHVGSIAITAPSGRKTGISYSCQPRHLSEMPTFRTSDLATTPGAWNVDLSHNLSVLLFRSVVGPSFVPVNDVDQVPGILAKFDLKLALVVDDQLRSRV